MKRVFLSAAMLGMTFALPAQSTEVTPAMSEKHAQAYVDYRQSVFTLLKSNIAPLGGMAKGKLEYDAQVMETNGMRMEQLADMLADYLKVDTSDSGVDSSAKAAIWSNFDDVEKKIANLKSAAAELQTIAKSGNDAQYRDAIGKVGGTCKSCHDDYKMD